MKRSLLVALLAAAALSACCPCRHLGSSSRDSLRVEIRTHTEYIRDTVLLEIPAQSERITTRDTTSHLENDYAASDARINGDGSLFHALRTKPQRKPIAYDRPVERRDSIVYRDQRVIQIVETERRLTWWQQTQMRGFWVLLAVLVLVCRKNICSLVRRFV